MKQEIKLSISEEQIEWLFDIVNEINEDLEREDKEINDLYKQLNKIVNNF